MLDSADSWRSNDCNLYIPGPNQAFTRKALQKYPEIEKAIVYDSCTSGNYKVGSDVDLVHYDELSNEDLKNHIDQYGKELYSKGVSYETKR